MIELIENLKLKKNDIILFKIDKRERIENIYLIIRELSEKLKFRIFGIVVRKEIDVSVLNKESKIKLKEMLEESLKED